LENLNVPAGQLETALKALAEQTNLSLVYQPEQVKDIKTQGLQGKYSGREAVEILLRGTHLHVYVTQKGAMVIAPDKPGMTQTSSRLRDDGEGAGMRVAQSDTSDKIEKTVSSQESSKQVQIEEIIVTAQKRQERLQDVPVPVTAISADNLADTNQSRLQDYYSQIPGLNLAPAVLSSQLLSIRGITTGYGNPTVGITVDDVPFGSSTYLGGGQVVPDIDPGDLDHIEVLRGPQGTLYGASSMGGLIKFVTVDPSTIAFSGRVQAGLEGVQNGAGAGYNVRASVNIPVSDTLAVRASGYVREDPGYVDDPVTEQDGVNETRAHGGRISALWSPSDTFSAKVSAIFQESRAPGSSDVVLPTPGFPSLGDLQNNYIPGSGGYDRKINDYSATLTAKLGPAMLTSLTGYNVNQFSDSLDLSYLVPLYGLPSTSGLAELADNKTKKFTQELRLSAPIGTRLSWLLGGFYTHENSSYIETLPILDRATGTPISAPGLLDMSFPTTFEELAGFTDLTVNIADRFDVQLGARYSHIKQSFSETSFGNVTSPETGSDSNSFTYLLTPRYKLSPEVMVYARLASGYRAGGPNAACQQLHYQCQYDPDKTRDYELGLKGDFLEHRLTVDSSLYYIDWSDIQVTALANGTGNNYLTNGGKAKSEGIELSTSVRPVSGLTLNAWFVWNEAVLTSAFPAASTVGADPGDALPYSSRISGNVSLNEEFPISGQLSGFAGGVVSYVDHRLSIFTSGAPRQYLPAYAKADLRAGLKYDTWTLNLYVNNATDRRGVLNGGYFPPYSFQIIQPRTVGMSIVKTL